jgi:hypothetical protein
MENLLRQGIDWTEFCQMAVQHGILPLVCWHLKNFEEEFVPAAIRARFNEYSLRIVQHNFRYVRELLKIVSIFNESSIPVIPFKGPLLAAAAYKNLALRTFSDLDILVHKKDVLRAKQLLLDHGYHLAVPLTGAQEAVHLRDDHVFELVREEGEISVELHWAITSNCIPFPLDLRQLEERIESFPLANQPVMNASPEDSLIILCVHGTKHIWERLVWVCDVAELIQARPDMNWNRVMARARATKSLRMVNLGLFLAHDLLHAPLPDWVQNQLQPDCRSLNLARYVKNNLFAEDGRKRLSDDIFLLKTMERVQDRVRYGLHLAITPSAEERALLPDSLMLFWWIIRPVRLLSKYGTGWVRPHTEEKRAH